MEFGLILLFLLVAKNFIANSPNKGLSAFQPQPQPQPQPQLEPKLSKDDFVSLVTRIIEDAPELMAEMIKKSPELRAKLEAILHENLSATPFPWLDWPFSSPHTVLVPFCGVFSIWLLFRIGCFFFPEDQNR